MPGPPAPSPGSNRSLHLAICRSVRPPLTAVSQHPAAGTPVPRRTHPIDFLNRLPVPAPANTAKSLNDPSQCRSWLRGPVGASVRLLIYNFHRAHTRTRGNSPTPPGPVASETLDPPLAPSARIPVPACPPCGSKITASLRPGLAPSEQLVSSSRTIRTQTSRSTALNSLCPMPSKPLV